MLPKIMKGSGLLAFDNPTKLNKPESKVEESLASSLCLSTQFFKILNAINQISLDLHRGTNGSFW